MMYIDIPEIDTNISSPKDMKVFEIAVLDFEDDYHVVDDIYDSNDPNMVELQGELVELRTAVKNLKRKYRHLGEYRKDLEKYNSYMNLLYIKYGHTKRMDLNKDIFEIKHENNQVKDYVPQKPKLVSKSLKKAFKAGQLGDDEERCVDPDIKAHYDMWVAANERRAAEAEAARAEMDKGRPDDFEDDWCYDDEDDFEPIFVDKIKGKKGKKAKKKMEKIFKKMAEQHGEKYVKNPKAKSRIEEEIDNMDLMEKQLGIMREATDTISVGWGKKKFDKKKKKAKKRKHLIADFMRADWKEYNNIVTDDDVYEEYKASLGLSYNTRYDDTDRERLRDMYMYERLRACGWTNSQAVRILGIDKKDAKTANRKYKKKKDSNGRRLYEEEVTITIGGAGSSPKTKIYYDSDDDFDFMPGDFPDEIIKEAYDMNGGFVYEH